MSGREKSSYSIKAVENALDVLEAFSEESGDMGIAQLSAKLGLNKSLVFRMLATFEQRGYVEPGRMSGRYRAGLSAYETGRKFLHRMDLLRKAKPVMENLARECNEAVYLAVPGKTDLLLLEMVEPGQQIQIMPLVGNRYSFEKFSAGRVILAFKGEFAELSGELRKALAEEASVDRGELGDGIGSLAIPLFDDRGVVCGSLCLVVPEFRFARERVEKELLPRLKAAGQTVSAKLGFTTYHLGKRHYGQTG